MNAKEALLNYQQHPELFVKNILGVKTLTWDGHREALNVLAKHNRLAIKSGHSMGKDFLAGIVSLWFLYCFPHSVVITTAPSDRQVQKIMWGEISKYWKSALGGTLKTQEIEIAPDWYAIGFTTKDTKNTVGRFQGFKGRNILIVATEAQAIEQSIYDQFEGVLTAENSKIYLAGNALGSPGGFYNAFNDPSYKTISWSCYDSPNYKAGKEVIPGMVGKAWVEDKEKRWGKDSPLFRSRVMAEFPEASIDTLISLPLLMACINREDVPAIGYVGAGADIARYGDCETVFKAVKGKREIHSEAKSGLSIPDNANELLKFCERVGANKVAIDDAGVGGGVTDIVAQIIKEKGLKLEVEGVLVGRPATGNYDFANLRAELLWNIRDMVIAGDCSILDDPDTLAQLSNIKYHFTTKGQIIMESKDDMRRRGLPSPDHGDALMLAFYAASLGWKPKAEKPVIEEMSTAHFREVADRQNGIKHKRRVKEYANFR